MIGSAYLATNLHVFIRFLRSRGLVVAPQQSALLLRALQLVDLGDREDSKSCCRSVLVSRHRDLALFDELFELFFRFQWSDNLPEEEKGRGAFETLRKWLAGESGKAEPDEHPELVGIEAETYSASEVLANKDFASLSEDEKRTVESMLRGRVLRLDPRRSRRRIAAKSGAEIDLRRVLRGSLRFAGEPIRLRWRKRKPKQRPLVVLCDISGSMEPYSRMFLQLMFGLKSATDRLEAFVFATRLTRISRELQIRDVDRALREAATRVVDWGGGTRIGDALEAFNFDWARRVLGQGAVVLVISDGWDRGELAQLEREVARLQRSCHRLIWLNPLIGSPGYEPLTRGIRAILPYIDDFLPIHNLASIGQLEHALSKPSSNGHSLRQSERFDVDKVNRSIRLRR